MVNMIEGMVESDETGQIQFIGLLFVAVVGETRHRAL
jgi:hypothetical protein